MKDRIVTPECSARNRLVASSHQGRNPPLERVVGREAVAEILALLTPAELVVALLRSEGMSDREIGDFLGIGRWAVRQRMVRARGRIVRTVPGMATMVEGRRRC